jgi:hypothetical protein
MDADLMCIDRNPCVTHEFSMFRSHINTVSDDNPCVTREFSMFRTDRRIVTPDIAGVRRAFSLFSSNHRMCDDRNSMATTA